MAERPVACSRLQLATPFRKPSVQVRSRSRTGIVCSTCLVRSEFGDEEEKRKMRLRYRKPSHFDRFGLLKKPK